MKPDHPDAILAYTYGHLSEVLRMFGDLNTAAYRGEQSLSTCLRTQNYARARETISALVAIYRDSRNVGRVNELLELEKKWP